MPKNINGSKLKSALEQFGSVDRAIDSMQKIKQQLEEKVTELKKLIVSLQSKVNGLTNQIHSCEGQISESETKLTKLNDTYQKYNYQYSLFEAFLAMLVSSPSVEQSLEHLVQTFQTLLAGEWVTNKQIDDLRDIFARTIFGDYLRCFRCSHCGTSFIVNKDPYYTYVSNYYMCPACHTYFGLNPDDGFLKAMVSGKQLENILLTQQYKAENDSLTPFKQLIGTECVICHKPINHWDDTSVDNALHGAGAAHTQCWGTELGRLKLLASVLVSMKAQGKIP